MRTFDLIELLARDTRAIPPGAAARNLLLALVAGGGVSLALVVLGLHCQPLEQAVRQSWFWMKAAYTGLLAMAAALTLKRLAVPGTRLRAAPSAVVLIVPAMTALAVVQILSAAPAGRLDLWLGHTWKICSPLILLLALPIYTALVLALRNLAPTHLTQTGAVAGLTAGALAATLYGLHCPEQAAAFVGTWYTLGIAAAGALGALSARWLLRW
jgi:hypothetical protein